jgi:hypothetical protein
MQAEWRHDPAVGKNARLHRFEKAHSPHRAIAAAMMAGPARTAPDGKLLQQHREARFQHFGIGQAAVGHVRLHHRRSVETARRPIRRRSSRSTGGAHCRR